MKDSNTPIALRSRDANCERSLSRKDLRFLLIQAEERLQYHKELARHFSILRATLADQLDRTEDAEVHGE